MKHYRDDVECVPVPRAYWWCAVVSITEGRGPLLFERHRAINLVLVALAPVVWFAHRSRYMLDGTVSSSAWAANEIISPSSGRGTLSSGVYPIAARPRRFIHLREVSRKNKKQRGEERMGYMGETEGAEGKKTFHFK